MIDLPKFHVMPPKELIILLEDPFKTYPIGVLNRLFRDGYTITNKKNRLWFITR